MKRFVYIPKPTKQRKQKKKKRWKKVLLTTAGVGAGLIGAIIAYNEIKTHFINNTNQSVDNFSPDNVFDDNDNDIQIDENGQIVLDDMTEKEKQLLTNQIEGLILQDAKYSQQIENVQYIMSINMLPSNFYEEGESNLYDKYRISILFSDGNDVFTLNYFAGNEFVSNEESSKNYVADFITYLGNIYLDGCEKVSAAGQKIMAAIEGAIFVGDAYVGYADSGDAYYFVPVYYDDGSAQVYYAMKSLIDRDNLDPMQTLLSEIELGEEDKKMFSISDVKTGESIQNVVDIYYEMKNYAEEKGNVEENADLGLN